MTPNKCKKCEHRISKRKVGFISKSIGEKKPWCSHPDGLFFIDDMPGSLFNNLDHCPLEEVDDE